MIFTISFSSAQEKYEDLFERINSYRISGDTLRMEGVIDSAMNQGVQHSWLYLNKGELLLWKTHKLKENVDSIAYYYKKSIDYDLNNWTALFNLGALYFNSGLEYKKEADELCVEIPGLFNKLLSKYSYYTLMSLEYFERAFSINQDDPDIFEALTIVQERVERIKRYNKSDN